MIKMDLSLLNDEAMDDSFLVIRPEAMDDEVTQIFKKWKLNNPLPKKDVENIVVTTATAPTGDSQFDSRTFTRPPRRRAFNQNTMPEPSLGMTGTDSELQSMESGIASINLQVGGPYTPMQRSWLKDVSPPSSICTSMDFQNNDTMLNSLVTSSDFTNVSFLLNGSVHENNLNSNEMPKHAVNTTITLANGKSNNQTIILNNHSQQQQQQHHHQNPTNATQNLMDFTYNVLDRTLTSEQIAGSDSTFVTDSEPPMKEFGIENADIQLNSSTEDFGKNLTFNKYNNNGNITWDKIQDQDLNCTVVQSTPIHKVEALNNHQRTINIGDATLSPISSFHAQVIDDDDEDGDEYEDGGELVLRSMKGRRLRNLIDDYRNSMEDQCEFLLNEETIKLSTRVCGDSFECLDDMKNALITSADANEREFDKMLDSFNVKKSKEGERLLQSVDSIKQRHSLINMEKQREEKHKRDSENGDNRTQYDVMNKSGSERLLNRRSRLFDDVNLQLQKQQQVETSSSNTNGSAGLSSSSSFSASQMNKTHNLDSMAVGNDAENDEVVDKNDRDRFKTIKLNRPRLHTAAMVVIDTEEEGSRDKGGSEISPGSNKERRNQLNQQRQEEEHVEFKRPPPPASRLSKFGFSRPTYRPRNDLNLPLKASSTDSLDNDSESSLTRQPVSNLKSPMGIKSKSIHNLMFNGAQNGTRTASSNLIKYSSETKSQSNLKTSRASSLVRQSVDTNFKLPQSNQSRALAGANKKGPGLVRPSSGYYGNSKRLDSDSESYSLSSSSASSRNSVHLSLAPELHHHQQQHGYLQSTEDLSQQQKTFGAVPKPSGISRPSGVSGLPRPQGIKSGLPRPRRQL